MAVLKVTRDDLLGYLSNDQVAAFLRLIREGESNQTESAYRILNGAQEYFNPPPWEHPNRVGRGGTSTAAGAYQNIIKTWQSLAAKYGLDDFSPTNQDCGAVALILEHGAMDDVLAGRVYAAIRRINEKWVEWECFQDPEFFARAPEVFVAHGGRLGEVETAPPSSPRPASPSITQEAKPMIPVPLILAGLEFLKGVFPVVSTALQKDDVKARNIEIGGALLDTATKVTNSANFQEAIQKIQEDPAAKKAVDDALRIQLPELIETGGGGIAAARVAAASPEQIPFWKNPAFVIAGILVPLIYMVAIEILFNPSKQTWSDDIKMMFVTAIVSGLLGSITGFFLGSSLTQGGRRAVDVPK